MKPVLSNQSGFSLTEIMIALTIVALAGGFVAVNVFNQFEGAKVKSAKIELTNMSSAFDAFYRDCNRYPSTEEGFRSLFERPANCKNWLPGGYLNKTTTPQDPWGNDYVYFSPPINSKTKRYEIISLGADGVEGGADNDADINSNTMDTN